VGLLDEMLSSRTRAEVFRLLFGTGLAELHMREIQRRSAASINAVQKELHKLARLDLINPRKSGNRTYYKANTTHPLFPDIRNLVIKTCGLADLLREALDGADVDLALVFGSVASGEADAGSDVDLMLIGNTSLRGIAPRLANAASSIGREINPVICTRPEFTDRLRKGDHLAQSVMRSPKVFVIGEQHELEAMAQ